MELQVEVNAERERFMLEETARLERFKEKETMYDNNLFDNVFFSSKSHRDMEVQPDIEPISYADNFAQFDHEEETQRNLLRKLEKQEVKQKAKIAKKALKEQNRKDRLRSAAAQSDLQQRVVQSVVNKGEVSSQKNQEDAKTKTPSQKVSLKSKDTLEVNSKKSIESRSKRSDVVEQ